MKEIDKIKITEIMGVNSILINSGLISAQNRKRLYWTNILNIEQPEDKHIYLKDIVENIESPKSFYYDNTTKIHINTSFKGTQKQRFKKWLEKQNIETLYVPKEIDVTEKQNTTRANRYRLSHIKGLNSKSRSISASCDITNSGGTGVFIDGKYRRLTPIECERLQTLPDNYTEGIINSKRYHAIGNGWTVDVIVHILKNLKGDNHA